jgi:hypothetical protein
MAMRSFSCARPSKCDRMRCSSSPCVCVSECVCERIFVCVRACACVRASVAQQFIHPASHNLQFNPEVIVLVTQPRLFHHKQLAFPLVCVLCSIRLKFEVLGFKFGAWGFGFWNQGTKASSNALRKTFMSIAEFGALFTLMECSSVSISEHLRIHALLSILIPTCALGAGSEKK